MTTVTYLLYTVRMNILKLYYLHRPVIFQMELSNVELSKRGVGVLWTLFKYINKQNTYERVNLIWTLESTEHSLYVLSDRAGVRSPDRPL